VSLIQPVEQTPPPTQVIGAEPPRSARTTEAPRPLPTIDATRTAPQATPAQTAAVKPAPERTAPRSAPDARTTMTTPAAPLAARPESSSKLKLEVLSYSDNPAQRLVFINGRRYKEGDTVEGGARVEEIREDGVVLSDQGQRFTLR
jgi:general secretion pathway protein B